MSKKIIAIIPARMASTRFPGKPMAEIHGMPMVGHVYHRASMCDLFNEVCVATCDEEIAAYVSGIGGRAVMTKETHERCTDRGVEALLKVERELETRFDIVVILQGDEPMTTPEMISQALQPMLNEPDVQAVNLMSRIENREQHDDPNEVKVVVDLKGDAIYFSREPIPSWKKWARDVPMLKQVCVMPFRRDFLLSYANLAPTPLEIFESVDMLRIIEHGFKVRMVMTDSTSYSVDNQSDLALVERAMMSDTLRLEYQTQAN